VRRILVTGSREWTDVEAIIDAVEFASGGGPFIVVHGDCPKGADALAEEVYGPFGMTEKHPAEWRTPEGVYNRAAGIQRNQKMVDLGADFVLAFPTPGGRGTQDCIRRARKAGLNVVVYGQEE
jgi:hypothetical protein